MQLLWQDIRFAFRMLQRNAGFAFVVILVLALGIGPNSAIFSMISATLLRPLPIEDPARVVIVWETCKQKGFDQVPPSPANYLDWRAQNRSFEDMAAVFAMPDFGLNVTSGGEPERVPGGRASAGYVNVLGVKPFLGRGFLPEEDRPGGQPVVMVSYGFWQRRLQSNPRVIGQSITVDAQPRTVVGVLPRGVDLFGRVDVWLPMKIDPSQNERKSHNFGAIARLKPGISLQRAQADMEVIASRLARQYPDTNEGWGVLITPVHEFLSGRIAPVLFILYGAVGLLLLLACANVANLLLARASSREKEVAIRTAIGAGRLRVLRQLVTESLILGLLGGTAGLLLGSWCISLLRGVVPDMLPLLKSMSLDFRVIAFTFGISLLTGIAFGIFPALKISRTDLNETLKAGGRSLTSSGVRARSVLLVAEVAMALVLSVAAGLLVRSFVRLLAVDPGLRTKGVLTMQLTLPWGRYTDGPKRAEFFKSLTQRIEALPGVRSAGAIQVLPFRGNLLNSRVSVWPFQVEGGAPLRAGQEPVADARIVTPGFFSTMGIPLVQGRYFNEHDSAGMPGVVIVNEAMARKHLPGVNPIGQRLRLPPDGPAREIVGVVGDVKLYALDWRVEPALYVPHAQRPHDVMSLVVHTEQDPLALAGAIRGQIRSLDPDQAVADVKTMDAVVADSLMMRRVAMLFLGAFAVLALVLATVGLYGFTAFVVSRRSHEIGLRMALGAQRMDVFRLMIGRGLALALIGTAFGLAGAVSVMGVLKSMLFGVTATDATVMVGVPLLLLTVSAVANFLPARRATKLDPIEALRYE
jgi:putative ABC transport system permease protein